MSSEDNLISPPVAVAVRLAGLRAQGPGALARAIGIDVPERYERALAGIYVGVDEGTRTNRKQKRARCKQRRRERLKSTRPAMHDAWLFDGAEETPVTFGGGEA